MDIVFDVVNEDIVFDFVNEDIVFHVVIVLEKHATSHKSGNEI